VIYSKITEVGPDKQRCYRNKEKKKERATSLLPNKTRKEGSRSSQSKRVYTLGVRAGSCMPLVKRGRGEKLA